MSTSRRICFLSHKAYGVLADVDTGHAGGIERQHALLARRLAGRGHDVSMVTWDVGQDDGTVVDGVRVHKMCRATDGVRFVRFVHPRWTSQNRALAAADADVYVYSYGDLGLGQLAWWCRRHRRKCVFSVASDPDCDPQLPALDHWRERFLYRYGLRRADRILVQTERQQAALRDGWGLASTVVPMPSEGIAGFDNGPPFLRDEEQPRVAWVGRFSPEKRLEWLLDIADTCPAIAFDVVGGPNAPSSYATGLIERARGIANVTLHGRVSDERLAEIYRGASLLCCTSVFEGFPNAFLEAWSLGIPLVSTHDPDGMVARHGLGVIGDDVASLSAGVQTLLGSRERFAGVSQSVRHYYLENHRVEAVLSRVEDALLSTLDTTSASRKRTLPGREPEGAEL